MGTERLLIRLPKQAAARPAAVCLFAGALLLMSAFAAAEDASPAPKAGENVDIFASIGRWFRDAGSGFVNLGHEAGVAARTTVGAAKDAADAVVRIPAARVIRGHEKCVLAPNGAPNCLAAANALCKGKGFESGKSVDMTTAEICPAQVYLSGRNSGPGCHAETFVSRALCQ